MLQAFLFSVLLTTLLSRSHVNSIVLSSDTESAGQVVERATINAGLSNSTAISGVEGAQSPVLNHTGSWEKIVANSRVRLMVYGMDGINHQVLASTLACMRSFVDHHIESLPDFDEPLAPADDPFNASKSAPGVVLKFQARSLGNARGKARMYWSDLEAVLAGLYSVMAKAENDYLFNYDVFDTQEGFGGRQLGTGWLKLLNGNPATDSVGHPCDVAPIPASITSKNRRALQMP
ncbi:uncharacterized protein KY384_005352 [Bacidia gigantensis]|uniref:uncharacterized protein n=1 Tax=Bacidia gigantensis TaxID=2732470 RepID=UPI001D036D1E|nr:uncharacterized protein KY384_005352 [Bacidia gigantensis]KAG8529871.1 hypothetical protein KY384_005352 [Bacidia gigantensis]